MKFMKLGSKPDLFQTNGKDVRFVATELATDIIVNVGDVTFYLHKFPLLSKSSLLQRLLTANNDEEDDEIQIPDIPGGAAAFEICAKFCYGMIVTLNAYNVIAARCAAEYLEMHETTEKGNLIYKIDVFLNTSIFRSWKDSIIVLQTTKSLLGLSEDLKLVSRCIDSVACKASVGASKVDWSYTYSRRSGIHPNWNGVKKQQLVPKDWWVEDLCELELDFYKRVMVAVKAKGRVSDKVVGEALKVYTHRRLPGFANGNMIEKGDDVKMRVLLETVIKLLPEGKGSVSCSFFMMLLRAVSLLDASETCKRELIKRIGLQLEEATVPELLLIDIDAVSSIVEEFAMQEKCNPKKSPKVTENAVENITPSLVSDDSKINVAKLVDGYLAEIAKDKNLPLSKFLDLAEMVCAESRPVHDGLYHAIDMYLKEHPSLTKSERKKLCNLMDCKNLSADACAQAVQNERLPLRTVIKVLFCEQSREPPTTSRHENVSGGSYGSSRSVTTANATDDNNWVRNLASIKPVKLGSGSSSCTNDANKINSTSRGINATPKKIVGKFSSNKGRGIAANGSSDVPGSLDELKSTPSRKMRQSVSRG